MFERTWRRLKGQQSKDVLVVGTSALGRFTGEDLARRGDHRVLGYIRCADDPPAPLDTNARMPLNAPLLGSVKDIEEILKAYPVSEVFIAGEIARQSQCMQQAVKACERIGQPFALPALNFRFERATPAAVHGVSDGYLHYVTVGTRPLHDAIKRTFDIFSAALALLLLSPLLMSVAALIKITSKGPTFFHQVRCGRYGRPFNMYKFRSMVTNAEALQAHLLAQNEQSGPVFKIKNDPRITAIGRFIRKFSIDELPQLINILKGDMTIVGPRPPLPAEVAKYQPWQRRRLSVRPGLTCIWQVSGRNDISFDEWMYLDMRYIDNWSLAHDLELIAKTFPVVITGRGAS